MSSEWPMQLAAQALSATTRRALLETALEQVRHVLDAPVRMIFHGRTGDEADQHVYAGLRALHFHEYRDVWSEHDPIRRVALVRRAAVRDSEVTRPIACDGFTAGFVHRIGAGPYLVAPLYGTEGALTGTLHVLRPSAGREFSAADAMQATAFAAFVSVMLVRKPGITPPSRRLAAREHQVALLAARGQSNGSIASELGIASETVKQTLRRVYRKVGVISRTELAARYARAGLV